MQSFKGFAVEHERIKEFEIPIVGLKQGKTEVSFNIDETFFKDYEGSDEFNGCQLKVDLLIDKRRNNLIVLTFYVGGYIQATCDRCLVELNQELLDEFSVYVKFSGDEFDSSNEEDVIVLSLGDTHMNVASLVYDFVNLSLPLQNGCPPNEVGGPKCDNKVLAFYEDKSKDDASDDKQEDIVDQRWSALLKIKKDNYGTSKTENIED